jgi:hypothetical protein
MDYLREHDAIVVFSKCQTVRPQTVRALDVGQIWLECEGLLHGGVIGSVPGGSVKKNVGVQLALTGYKS